MEPVRILIADDHEIVRRGIRSLFSLRPGWEICGEAVDGRDAVEKAKQLRPEVILLDISMPLLNGLEAARIIRKEVPDTKILMVSQHEAAHMGSKALEAGARGYVAKSDLSRELVAAVERLLNGHATRQAAETPAQPAAVEPRLNPSASSESPASFLIGGGELGALMRSMDWSKTRLGPPETWPESLAISLNACLNSRFPILIWWGPELVMLYNDAYRQIIGSKHPAALGNPGRDCWSEIWTTIGPMLDAVLNRGESTWSDDLLLLLQRHGYLEECYFTFSYSPIRDRAGRIGGVFTPVKETTRQVIGERRMRTLYELATHAIETRSEKDAWQSAGEALSRNLFDLPFSILCESAGPACRLSPIAGAGIDLSHPLCALLSAPESPLTESINQALHSGKAVEASLEPLGLALPRGAWDVAPEKALLLPILPSGQEQASGLLFAAVSPRKQLDAGYRSFYEFIARQIASNLGDIRTFAIAQSQAETRSRLAALVECSDDAIVSKDLNGIITSWNSGAERIFGYTAEEAVGRSITLIIPDELREEENTILQRLRLGQRIDHFETVRVAKSGKRLAISLSVSPIIDATGKVVGASKIARDVTERKHAEQALRDIQEQLETRVKERTADLQRAQDDLRALSRRLLQAQDDERRRIARELHDTAGQVLAALNMNLIPLEKQMREKEPSLAKPLAECVDLVNELSADLRTISHLLHPPLLDEAGLTSALRWFVEGFSARSKIAVDLQLPENLGRLNPEMEAVIFRMVQECLTNVHRHSGSAVASIRILRENGGIRLEVRDQGRGVANSTSIAGKPGVGIQGMRERVRQFGGTLTIAPGNPGTVVTAVLPEALAYAHTAGESDLSL